MKKAYKYISIILFFAAMAVLTVIAIPFIQSARQPEQFEAFIDRFGILGIFMMLFIQIVQIVVALIPGELIEFVAGSMYGWIGGLLVCLTGITIGQTIIFKLVKTFGKDFVEAAAGSSAMNKIKFLKDEKKLKRVIFLLFFVPGTPKDLLTYAAPFTSISLRDFLLITLIARIPTVMSSTYAGDAFAESKFKTLLITYGIIAIISIIGIGIYKLYLKSTHRKQNKAK